MKEAVAECQKKIANEEVAEASSGPSDLRQDTLNSLTSASGRRTYRDPLSMCAARPCTIRACLALATAGPTETPADAGADPRPVDASLVAIELHGRNLEK